MKVEIEIKLDGARYAKLEAYDAYVGDRLDGTGDHELNDELVVWIAANGEGPRYIGLVTSCRACGVPALVGRLAERLGDTSWVS